MDIEKLKSIENTEGFDEKEFYDAKTTLIKIVDGKVSASMSGIEYCEPYASWIISQCK